MSAHSDSASAVFSAARTSPVQGNGWARELIVPGAIPALDALRAFAIILVLLRHGVRPFWDSSGHVLVPLGDWDLAVPLINGWVGADLFFVLSGFLIGRQLISAKARSERGPRALVRYLLRRALRILPAYYAVLALAALGLVPYYAISPDYLWLRSLGISCCCRTITHQTSSSCSGRSASRRSSTCWRRLLLASSFFYEIALPSTRLS